MNRRQLSFPCAIESWTVILCLVLSLHCAAEQYVELTTEIQFDGWDWHFFNDKLNRYAASNSVPSIFQPSHTFRCVVGAHTWLVEHGLQTRNVTYWFTGTNIIEQAVSTNRTLYSKISESADGNPGRPVRVADLMTFDSPARFCWLVFCSGSFLKRDGRQIFPPADFWKESSLVYSGWSDKTTTFEDGLGLPKSVDLIATNNQPIFQYQVHRSTNVLGWNFPLEFYCVHYLPAHTNLWKLDFTAKGRLISIKEGTKPEIPAEVLERIEK